ncbi:MAG: alpha/beta hydrolase family protein [Usitatibacter sp.]
MPSSISPRDTAKAADGYDLAVTRFPARGTAWATLCVGGAMGVRQDFYAPFASFLAENGIHVLTFDYRGSGWSRPRKLADFKATVTEWADQDLDAMLVEARRPAPQLPLLFVGHSLGGQILGLARHGEDVRAIVNVTAGSGYYKLNEKMAVHVRVLWFVLMPLLLPLFGYFPGKRLRMIGDLPLGVAWQWRKWCLHPDYVLSEGGDAYARFARVKAPILSLSFTDDAMITRRAIGRVEESYPNARIDSRHVAPRDLGLGSIGHFGFFSQRMAGTLWKDSLEWLRAKAAGDPENA